MIVNERGDKVETLDYGGLLRPIRLIVESDGAYVNIGMGSKEAETVARALLLGAKRVRTRERNTS